MMLSSRLSRTVGEQDEAARPAHLGRLHRGVRGTHPQLSLALQPELLPRVLAVLLAYGEPLLRWGACPSRPRLSTGNPLDRLFPEIPARRKRLNVRSAPPRGIWSGALPAR
jgi:hypothetical protein